MKLDFVDRLVVRHVVKQISNKDGSINMNALEALAISVILAVLQQTVKNPSTSAEVKAQLTSVASEILETYGYTVTAPPAVPA